MPSIVTAKFTFTWGSPRLALDAELAQHVVAVDDLALALKMRTSISVW
jgi:hypothetical protein